MCDDGGTTVRTVRDVVVFLLVVVMVAVFGLMRGVLLDVALRSSPLPVTSAADFFVAVRGAAVFVLVTEGPADAFFVSDFETASVFTVLAVLVTVGVVVLSSASVPCGTALLVVRVAGVREAGATRARVAEG